MTTKVKLFDDISKFRVASYPIQDLHLLKADWIVAMEEEWLSHFGYDFEEYDRWLNTSEISNPKEHVEVAS